MATFSNLSGTTSPSFKIGKGGVTIHQGTAAPDSGDGLDGDLYIRTGSSSAIYQKIDGTWTTTNDVFIRQQVAMGATANATGTYVAVVAGQAANTNVTLHAGSLGQKITIKDEVGNAAVRAITISSLTGETIDGSSSYTIASNYGSVTLNHIGSSWIVIRRT